MQWRLVIHSLLAREGIEGMHNDQKEPKNVFIALNQVIPAHFPIHSPPPVHPEVGGWSQAPRSTWSWQTQCDPHQSAHSQ